MKFLRFFLLSIFIISCSVNSYAQKSNKSSKVKKEKKTKEKKAPKQKKQKKEKPPKEQQAKEEGVDKNFGPIFDGVSISASAGINIYFGDLADYNMFPKINEIGKYSTSAFKFSIARDIKWGLGAKLNYQSGKLEGTRQPGKQSSTISFENSFYDISLQPQLLISDVLFKKNDSRRLKIYAHVGIGYMWYRTQQYDTETRFTRDYEGYIAIEGTESLSQKTLSDKTPKATALTIPYGLTFFYKINHKIDLHLDFTQSSTNTDRLDAFRRDWTAKDKYDYIGIGLTYNFNRTSDDAPKKRSKKDDIKKFDEETTLDSSTKEPKKGLFNGLKKKKKSSKEDELLNVRLKLFETQLKLFEMQYLLGK